MFECESPYLYYGTENDGETRDKVKELSEK